MATLLVAAGAVVILATALYVRGIGEPGPSPDPSIDSPLPSSVAPSSTPDFGVLPNELHGLAWVGSDGNSWLAGSLAGPALTLPPGEVGLDAEGLRVLALDPGPPSTLLVRDLTTGDLIATLATDLKIDNGVIRGNRIYVSARSSDGALDGGVWQADVGAASLDPLIPATPEPPPKDGPLTRGVIALSPSGNTLASTVCTVSGCATQIADVASAAVSTVDDYYVVSVSDEYLIVSERPNLRAYGLNDLELRWELGDSESNSEFWDSYFLADERTLLLSWREGVDDASWHYEIARVDAETGARQVVATFTGPEADFQLIADLGTDHYAVILEAFFLEVALRDNADFRVLDLTTGLLLPYAFPLVGSPQ
jgi:hypothetical protein